MKKNLTKRDKALISRLKKTYPSLTFDSITPEFLRRVDKFITEHEGALRELAKK